MSKSIHPAELTADHVGALVRWENGNTTIQGRLEYVAHTSGDDVPVELGYPSGLYTRFDIEGARTIFARANDPSARLAIIREAGE